MFKKILIIFTVIILVSGLLAACKKKTDNNENSEVKKTGKIIDISNMNNQIVSSKPGDIILLVLIGEKDSKYQWSFREPISGGYLSLEKHSIIEKNDKRLGENEIISEWKIKVLKEGVFNLRFDYENPFEDKPKKVFKTKIYSGQDISLLGNIIIDSPQADQEIESPLVLSGYARVFEGTVNYRLKDEAGKILAEGFSQSLAGPPAYGYFEQKIEFAAGAKQNLILEVFQISAKDGTEIDKITIELVNS